MKGRVRYDVNSYIVINYSASRHSVKSNFSSGRGAVRPWRTTGKTVAWRLDSTRRVDLFRIPTRIKHRTYEQPESKGIVEIARGRDFGGVRVDVSAWMRRSWRLELANAYPTSCMLNDQRH